VQAKKCHQINAKLRIGDNPMISQFPTPSVTLSMLISETAYRAVVGVASLVNLMVRMLRLDSPKTEN
jgi:hypothetical protein